MTRAEFSKLKVGDKCVFKTGRDAGRECIVAYIEHEHILVRAADGKAFRSLQRHRNMRLTGMSTLTPVD